MIALMSAFWLWQASPSAAAASEAGEAATAAVAGAAAEAVSAALAASVTGGSFELFSYLPLSLTHQLLTMQFPFNLKSF